ncbi:hypothetical protein K1X76_11380 [bacterium]|nr:hypothetical protein [bacterium]
MAENIYLQNFSNNSQNGQQWLADKNKLNDPKAIRAIKAAFDTQWRDISTNEKCADAVQYRDDLIKAYLALKTRYTKLPALATQYHSVTAPVLPKTLPINKLDQFFTLYTSLLPEKK